MTYNTKYGNPGRYNSTLPTVPDGEGAALAVDANGRLITVGGGTGSAAQVEGTSADNAAATGNPVLTGAEYNASAPTYSDGDVANNQADVNGNQKVTLSGTAATVAQVASSATSVTLLAANTSRREAIIFNDSTQVLYIKYGTTASATSYTAQLGTGDTLIEDKYTGRIDGIWAAANGNAYVTEVA